MLHTIFTPTTIAAALIAINLVAFAAFGLDKAKARRGEYRIAESTLLLFAFLGGTLGLMRGAACSATRPASSRSIPTCSRSQCCRCSRWAG